MNVKVFKALFPKVQLKPSKVLIGNYGNSAEDIVNQGKFQCFLEFKGNKFLQIFHVTNADRFPNLLYQDTCYMLGVIKPCYSKALINVQQYKLQQKIHSVPSLNKPLSNKSNISIIQSTDTASTASNSHWEKASIASTKTPFTETSKAAAASITTNPNTPPGNQRGLLSLHRVRNRFKQGNN